MQKKMQNVTTNENSKHLFEPTQIELEVTPKQLQPLEKQTIYR